MPDIVPTESLEIELADKEFSTGKEILSPVALPDDGVGFSGMFELPTQDEDVDIEVNYLISEDDGATWREFGGFKRTAGPWVGLNGKPITRCGITFELRNDKGELVGPPKGCIIKSEVTVTKNISGKILMSVDVKSK